MGQKNLKIRNQFHSRYKYSYNEYPKIATKILNNISLILTEKCTQLSLESQRTFFKTPKSYMFRSLVVYYQVVH